MSISSRTIEMASVLRDQSGHGTTGAMSDMPHVWIEPGHGYGLAFNGFTAVGIRDVAEYGDECYVIGLCDLDDVEALRVEAVEAGDEAEAAYCAAALAGDLDALLLCVERIIDVQIESAA